MQLSTRELFRYDPIPRKYLREVMDPRRPVVPGTRGPLTAEELRSRFPDGVPLAIWHNAVKKAEMYTFNGSALKWAATWSGLGPTLVVGRAWRDDLPIADTVLALTDQLRRLTGDDGAYTRVRDLAIFCHGQTTNILYRRSHLQTGQLGPLVARLAGSLSPAVRVVLYACNTGRTPGEAPDWQRTTLDDGGSPSFAGALRDLLVRAGKPECEVWSHTTRGHTAYNSALRVFRGADGEGSDGVSFARAYVHDWPAAFEARARQAVGVAGFKVGPADEARFLAAARTFYEAKFYAHYGATCRNKALLVDGQRLAMAAPMNPGAVGALIARRWDQRWRANLATWGAEIARKAKLKG